MFDQIEHTVLESLSFQKLLAGRILASPEVPVRNCLKFEWVPHIVLSPSEEINSPRPALSSRSCQK